MNFPAGGAGGQFFSVQGARSDEYGVSSSDERRRNEGNWPQPSGSRRKSRHTSLSSSTVVSPQPSDSASPPPHGRRPVRGDTGLEKNATQRSWLPLQQQGNCFSWPCASRRLGPLLWIAFQRLSCFPSPQDTFCLTPCREPRSGSYRCQSSFLRLLCSAPDQPVEWPRG